MRLVGRLMLVVVALAIVLTALPARNVAHAQGGQTAALVIEGGTLIDGNGGAPVRDVQIVVEGNRITRIGRKGQPTPTGAQVINADGKFIVPGLFDALANYKWYQGEVFLNNGVTSVVGMGDLGPIAPIYAQGVERGRIRGPRLYDWVTHFGGLDFRTEYDTPFMPPALPKTPEEARQMMKWALDLGSAGMTFHDGLLKPELFKAATEVAHAAGKPMGVRAGGFLPAREASMMGADFIPRSEGVADEAAGDVAGGAITEGVRGGQNELDVWAAMDEAKAAELIKVFAQNKTALIPSMIEKAVGMPRSWERFELQTRRLFADPFLASYLPERVPANVLNNAFSPDLPNLRPQGLEGRRKGFQNALRFHRMLVQAGGRVLAGTDGGMFVMPGIGVHHELQTFVEDMGLTPMQAIQSATKWVAETMRIDKEVGTVETGKFADIVLVNADPLANIQNLQNISAVIANGRVQDLRYHGDYRSPFGGSNAVMVPVVDDLPWAANVRKNQDAFREDIVKEIEDIGAADTPIGQRFAAIFQANANPRVPGGLGPALAPQPTIETIDSGRKDYADAEFSKAVVKEGGATLMMTIKGVNYFQRSQVFFNGVPVPTKVKTRFELEATIDQSFLLVPGRYPIVVTNLAPAGPADERLGNATSNTGWLIVAYK